MVENSLLGLITPKPQRLGLTWEAATPERDISASTIASCGMWKGACKEFVYMRSRWSRLPDVSFISWNTLLKHKEHQLNSYLSWCLQHFSCRLTESPFGPGGPSDPGGPWGKTSLIQIKCEQSENLKNICIPEAREHQAIQSPHQDQGPPKERCPFKKFATSVCCLFIIYLCWKSILSPAVQLVLWGLHPPDDPSREEKKNLDIFLSDDLRVQLDAPAVYLLEVL